MDLAQDADYINICGNGSNICGSSIEAYEDSEGGTGVTADLTAQIVGDPQLQFLNVTVSPDQLATGGLVGNEAAAGVIPEPSTCSMIILGFAGIGFIGYRTKRASDATAA